MYSSISRNSPANLSRPERTAFLEVLSRGAKAGFTSHEIHAIVHQYREQIRSYILLQLLKADCRVNKGVRRLVEFEQSVDAAARVELQICAYVCRTESIDDNFLNLWAGDLQRQGQLSLEDLRNLIADETFFKACWSDGRYLPFRCLGRGGMGVVYEVWHREHSRLMAMKVLPELRPERLIRFKREFRSISGLVHPNLVTLYDLLVINDRWCFTMELIDGDPFLTATRDADSRALDEAALRAALRQLAEGVDFLHTSGYVHRDLKPSNVLMTEDGRVVILDFGLAVPVASRMDAAAFSQSTEVDLQPETNVAGTPAYMAPEQTRGSAATRAADWFAVGVMLYEALVGTRPFNGSPLEVLLAKEQERFAEPKSCVDSVPETLNALCVELLSADPQRRAGAKRVIACCSTPGGLTDRPISSRTQANRFFGRVNELRALQDAYAELNNGNTVVAHIRGASGCGKTRLIKRFIKSIARREQVVFLQGRCFERESVPFKALDGLFDAIVAHLLTLSELEVAAVLPRDTGLLARVFPVLMRVPAVRRARERGLDGLEQTDLRRHAINAFRELLARLGDRTRLVITIDDLQWGDVDSAKVLTELLLPPDQPRFLLVVAYRVEASTQNDFVKALDAEPSLAVSQRHIDLDRMLPDETRQMASAFLETGDGASQELIDRIVVESEGLPFFVQELALAARHAASFTTSGGIDLQTVLRKRVADLPSSLKVFVSVVAVAGKPIASASASRAANVDLKQADLIFLKTDRFLRSHGSPSHEEVVIYHDRMRESILSSLTPEEIVHYHECLAGALEPEGFADIETIAVHYHMAGKFDQAVRYYAEAADAAFEAVAFDRAARLYGMCLELDSNPSNRRSLHRSRAEALEAAGRGVEAAREYQHASEGSSGHEVINLQSQAAYQLLISGHVREGREALDSVLRTVGLSVPKTRFRVVTALLASRLSVLIRGLRFSRTRKHQTTDTALQRLDVMWLASASLSSIDPVVAALCHVRNLTLALQAGEPRRAARALAWEAAHVSIWGVRSRRHAMRAIKEAQAIVEELGDAYAEGILDMGKGIAAFSFGEWQSGSECLQAAELRFREHCRGVAWERATASTYRLWCLAYLGELTQMRHLASRLLRDALDRGDLYTATNLSTFSLPLLALADDHPDRADDGTKEYMAHWTASAFHVQHMTALMGATYVDLYRDAPVSALDRLTGQWPKLRQSWFLHFQVCRVLLWELRARALLGMAAKGEDERRCLHEASRIASILTKERVPYADAMAELIIGGVAMLEGQTYIAMSSMRAAVDGFERVGMRLFAVALRRRLGEALDDARGRDLIAKSDDWMSAQGIQSPERMTRAFVPWTVKRSTPKAK